MPCPGQESADAAADFPCIEGLIAGTVALMTIWADPCPASARDPLTHRLVLARKIVSNLFFLQKHPYLSPPMRQVMANAHRRWTSVACEAEVLADAQVPCVPPLSARH